MRLLGRIGIALVALLAVAFLYLTFRPIAGGSVFAGEVNAAADHDAAVAKFNAGLAAADGPEVDPRCRSSLSDHGVTTDVVVVIFHGYTNCPYGFAGLAQAIFDRGANVLVPRLPHHGLLDRIGPQGHTWTAEEMVALADEAVDVARGLGRKVVVVGLSAGGAIASWVAQNRPDVDRVVGLQPFLGIKYVPTLLGSQMVNLAETLPDSLAWWDDREASIPPDYGYPQRSTRAVAEALRLSAITIDQAGSTAPAAKEIVLTNNVNDPTISPDRVRQLVDAWQAKGGNASVFDWPADMQVGHNMVDDADTPPEHLAAARVVLLQLILGDAG